MNSNSQNLNDIPEREIWPGFHGRLIHTNNMTFAYWRVEKGSGIHEHHHHHEQVVNMQAGEFELIVNGESQILKAGDIVVIPSNAKHSGTAITDCKILDVFSPAREDYQ